MTVRTILVQVTFWRFRSRRPRPEKQVVADAILPRAADKCYRSSFFATQHTLLVRPWRCENNAPLSRCSLFVGHVDASTCFCCKASTHMPHASHKRSRGRGETTKQKSHVWKRYEFLREARNAAACRWNVELTLSFLTLDTLLQLR